MKLTLPPFMVKKIEVLGLGTIIILGSEGESGSDIHAFAHVTNIY